MHDANMFLEKRIHPRVAIKIPLRYRVIDDQKLLDTILDRKKKEKMSVTLDVSLGGLYLVADEDIPVSSILRLDFDIPGHTHVITSFTEVVRNTKNGVGLRFLAMSEMDANALKNFITSKT